jgi:hypothetical protein
MARKPSTPTYTLPQTATACDMPVGTIGTWATRGWLTPIMDLGITRTPTAQGGKNMWQISRNAIRAMAIMRTESGYGMPPELPGLAVQAVYDWLKQPEAATRLCVAYTDEPDQQVFMSTNGVLPDRFTHARVYNLTVLFGSVDAVLDRFDAEAELRAQSTPVDAPTAAARKRAPVGAA